MSTKFTDTCLFENYHLCEVLNKQILSKNYLTGMNRKSYPVLWKKVMTYNGCYSAH